jgi:hypothetical protein
MDHQTRLAESAVLDRPGGRMPTLIFLCPATGLKVQGFVAEGLIGPDTICVPVDCVLCSRSHLIDPRISELPDSDESTDE